MIRGITISRAALFVLAMATGVSYGSAPQANPFRPRPLHPPHQHKDDHSGYHLAGIFITPYGRSAIINGRRVRAGQHVDQGIVLKITPTWVLLRRAGHRIRLDMTPTSVLQPAGGQQ